MDWDAIRALEGRHLPGGVFTIDPSENSQLCSILECEPLPKGSAHPLYAYIATQRAMGITVNGLFEMFGVSMDAGPMLATTVLQFGQRPLKTGSRYEIDGRILQVERKNGRKLGLFDLVAVELRLLEDGAVAAHAVNSFVMPRAVAE
jgi:hypothetical protein